jgi:hypothetical protein
MIKSIKAIYAFLDEMQDYMKWEVGISRLRILDCGLRIYEDLEGANRIGRASSKTEREMIRIFIGGKEGTGWGLSGEDQTPINLYCGRLKVEPGDIGNS